MHRGRETDNGSQKKEPTQHSTPLQQLRYNVIGELMETPFPFLEFGEGWTLKSDHQSLQNQLKTVSLSTWCNFLPLMRWNKQVSYFYCVFYIVCHRLRLDRFNYVISLRPLLLQWSDGYLTGTAPPTARLYEPTPESARRQASIRLFFSQCFSSASQM